jgi:hypothetical protein
MPMLALTKISRPSTFRACQCELEPVEEQRPVRQPGQRVVERVANAVRGLGVCERHTRLLGEGQEHLPLRRREAMRRVRGADDERSDDDAVLVERHREYGLHACLEQVGGHPWALRVVLDDRDAALGDLAPRDPSRLWRSSGAPGLPKCTITRSPTSSRNVGPGIEPLNVSACALTPWPISTVAGLAVIVVSTMNGLGFVSTTSGAW